MSLLTTTRAVRDAGKKALVPFLTAGYPDEETFRQLLAVVGETGCPVVEVGIPFSDPLADGPLIQESSQRALAAGMTLSRALELIAEVRPTNPAALVIMSYLNPILQMGIDTFAERAAVAGVQGVIIPDLPLEESGDVRRILTQRATTLIDLIAPTSRPERVTRITAVADGFLYLVSLTGVTGVRQELAADLEGFIKRVRQKTDLPLYVGFGVSTSDQARRVVRHADGVIIGSAIIRQIQAAPDNKAAVVAVRAFLKEVAAAIGRDDTVQRSSDRSQES